MKTVLFFCDINGALTGENSMSLLVNRLENLRDVYHCQKLIFSIVSSEHIGIIKNYVNEIMRHENNIVLGKQFYGEGYIDYQKNEINNANVDKSKLGQMMNYIKELKDTEDLKMICYADDNASELYIELFNKVCPESMIKILVPSKKIDYPNVVSSEKTGIVGLYSCLDSIICKKCKETHSYKCKTKSNK